MADILEGLVIDIIDGEMLELDVEYAEAGIPGHYGAHEYVRVCERDRSGRHDADADECAALMAVTYQNRRVRVLVQGRDDQGSLIGVVDVLTESESDHNSRGRNHS